MHFSAVQCSAVQCSCSAVQCSCSAAQQCSHHNIHPCSYGREPEHDGVDLLEGAELAQLSQDCVVVHLGAGTGAGAGAGERSRKKEQEEGAGAGGRSENQEHGLASTGELGQNVARGWDLILDN